MNKQVTLIETTTADTMGPDGPIPGGLGANAWCVRLRERRAVHYQTVEQESHLAPFAAKHIALTGFSPLSGHPHHAAKNARTCSNVLSFDVFRRHLQAVINSSNAKNKATALTE